MESQENSGRFGDIIQAVLIGIGIMLVGTIPRNILFAANLNYFPSFPWAAPVSIIYLFFFWRYLNGWGDPQSTRPFRRKNLRSNPLSGHQWFWSVLWGVIGIVWLVLVLKLTNRMIKLPPQTLPDLSAVPPITVITLLLTAAPIAGVVEEAAFRGYMQKPLEESVGIFKAILITGTMFAVAHLDFTFILWPYYVLVSAVYGTVAYHCQSILPCIVLHTGGNIYSNLDLWLSGQTEWQADPAANALIWENGPDQSFWTLLIYVIISTLLCLLVFRKLKATSLQGRGKYTLL